MESTLERELNVPEIVADQAIGTSLLLEMCSRCWVLPGIRFYRSRETALTRVVVARMKPRVCSSGNRPMVYRSRDFSRRCGRISPWVPLLECGYSI